MMRQQIQSLDELRIMNDLEAVSAATGLAVITLRREIRRGKLRVFRASPNGKILVRREEIERYIRDNEL